jgi:hypothetical protein
LFGRLHGLKAYVYGLLADTQFLFAFDKA